MFRQAVVLVLVFGLIGLGVLTAQEAAKKPVGPAKPAKKKPPPAAKEVALKATVVSVAPPAHKRVAAPNTKWEPLKVGDVLAEQTLIRTGLGAKVVLDLAGRGGVVIDNAGKMGIGELRQRGKVVKARLGLKYGTMKLGVDTAAGPNDMQLSTPVATLSARDSLSKTTVSERGASFSILKHRWDYFLPHRTGKRLRQKESGNDQGDPWDRLLREFYYLSIRDPGWGQSPDDHGAQVDVPGGRSILNGASSSGFFDLFGRSTCADGDDGYNGYDNGYQSGYSDGYGKRSTEAPSNNLPKGNDSLKAPPSPGP